VACGPGIGQGGTDVEAYFFQGAWGEYEWECVELVMRYMYLVFGIVPYSANGDTVVSNYNGNVLTQVSNNGTSLPSPGDILSWAGSDESPNGHTAIVTAVNVANGSGTITVMQQNASADGWGTVSVADNVLTTQISGGSVTGWLHNPNAGSSS
jgi:CHAP domain